LQNAGKLPFIFSVACVNGKFMWTGGPCFAEAWLRATQGGQPTGAVATFMATVNLSWWPPMTAQDEFVNIVMDLPSQYGSVQPGIKRTIAGAMLNASQKMRLYHGSSGDSDYQSWCVFGDPTLMFRTKTPQAMTATHAPEISNTANSLSVTCVAGALAALSYIDDGGDVVILGSTIAESNNIAVINFTLPATPPESVKLAVTGFNKVTYLNDIPVTSTEPLPCEPPTLNVDVYDIGFGCGYSISWAPPESTIGLLGYYLYVNGVNIGSLILQGEVIGSQLDYGASITFQTSAIYEHCGESELTEGITVECTSPYQFCEPPVELTGNANGNTAHISWYQPINIDGVLIGYNIYQDNVKIGETVPSVQEYFDGGLANGTYIYKVSAMYEHCEESEFSDSQTVVISYPVLCEKPAQLAGTSNINNASLTWDEPINIDGILIGYNVYRDNIQIWETDSSEREYIDENLENGTFIYQVSAKYEHCEESELTEGVLVEIYIEGINEIQPDAYKIFPNPANNEITIQGEGIRQLEIHDVTGKILFSHPLISSSSLQKINISHLASGVYLIKIYPESNDPIVKRLVIIK
jgi:hypothetical protein